jgi:hypothetical protein
MIKVGVLANILLDKEGKKLKKGKPKKWLKKYWMFAI